MRIDKILRRAEYQKDEQLQNFLTFQIVKFWNFLFTNLKIPAIC